MMRKLFGRAPPRVLDLETFTGNAYVIGDIHGCLGLLKGLELKIIADAKGQAAESLLICLGDMIDRGPDSHGVLAHLMAAPPSGFRRICLMGNHEEMMLKFMAAPSRNAAWLGFGGLETLCSYGALENEIRSAMPSPRKMKFLIERIIPKTHTAFLSGLAHAITLKDFVISHAGGNPVKPIKRQSVEDYIWGTGAFPQAEPNAPKEIVHGHFVVNNPQNSGGVISIDTGAYAQGALTAVKLGPAKSVAFLTFSRG